MSGENDEVDLDARSFNLDSVETVDDDVDVQNELICEDRVGVDVNVEVNMEGDASDIDNLSLPRVDEQKKKDFERQRDEILMCVPEEVKARFGEIFFSTFGKFVGPVLIMNPYKVSPGLLRDQWVTMFHNCQKSGREKQMTHLTYWYGQFNDLPNAYSFQKTTQLLSYEKGMKKTEKKLNGIHQKQDAGKKISSKELNFMKGFEEMEADRSKEPAERFGYIDSKFLEDYHVLLGENDNQMNNQSKKQMKTTKSAPELKLSQKKKRVKKGEGSTQNKKKASEAVEKGEIPKQKKKNPKKRLKLDVARSKKRIKKKGADVHDSKIGEKSLVSNEKEKDINKKDSLKGSVEKDDHSSIKSEDKKLDDYEEFARLDDVPSHGGTGDGSLKMDELESDEDIEDEDYTETPKFRIPKSSMTKKIVKARPKKKVQKRKIKIESCYFSEQKSDNSNMLLKKEQRKFHECEMKYLPLLLRWENAITDKNAAQLSRIFDELIGSMEHFTAPFIEEYSMSDLMKRSKGYNNEKRKKVLAKFKTIYKGKKLEVPKGFKAIKKSETYTTSTHIKTDAATKDEEQLKAPNASNVKQNRSKVITPCDVSLITQDVPIPKDSLSSRITPRNEFNGEISPHVMPESALRKHSKPEIKPEPFSQKQTMLISRSEKKKRFSLGNLMRAGSSSSRQVNVSTKLISSVEESPVFSSKPSTNNKHKKPSWTTEIVSDEDYSNENRAFGLEFLQQAAFYIPESKSMNYKAVARNIEIATYKWSTEIVNTGSIGHNEDERLWLNNYWNKIHDLAACISGKYEGGTLAKMICDGKFTTPDKLVCLRDEDLLCSFEGLPLSEL